MLQIFVFPKILADLLAGLLFFLAGFCGFPVGVLAGIFSGKSFPYEASELVGHSPPQPSSVEIEFHPDRLDRNRVRPIWGLFFKTAPFPSQVKYFFKHLLANFKIQKLIQKCINLRQ